MNRKLRVFTIAAIVAAVPIGRPARAQIDVHIGIPLPRIVFETEPQVVVIPNTNVYYAPSVNEYDTYRVGPYWYVNRDGYWYRARGHHAQFRPVPYRRVPRQIVGVPEEYRRHPMRPERRDVRGQYYEGGDSKHRGKHQGKHHQHD